jgi:hypothetical protein
MRRISKEEVAKHREHSMRLSDFHIGLEFWMSGSRWRCTDVGSRVVIAIKLDHDDDPSWYNGPPYAVCEHAIDKSEIHICSLTRHGGNLYSFTDEQIEQSRTSGKANIVVHTVPPRSPEEQESFEAKVLGSEHRGKWIEEKPMRNQQAATEWEPLKALRAKNAACETGGRTVLNEPSSDQAETDDRSKIAAEQDAYLRAAIQEALDDPSPLIPHTEVEAHVAKRRADARSKVKGLRVRRG